jgi:chromosome segregation ATPase
MASSDGGTEDAQEPSQDDGNNWHGYFNEALKIIQEHRKELAVANVEAEAYKQEVIDLKRRLTKAESEKNWMHGIIEHSHDTHVNTIAILNANSECMTLHIEELEAELAGEKLCHQEEIKTLQRKQKSTASSSRAGKIDTADASTWVDNLSGQTRWADLYDPSCNE